MHTSRFCNYFVLETARCEQRRLQHVPVASWNLQWTFGKWCHWGPKTSLRHLGQYSERRFTYGFYWRELAHSGSGLYCCHFEVTWLCLYSKLNLILFWFFLNLFFGFQPRGSVEVKGKGIMQTFWVLGKGPIAAKTLTQESTVLNDTSDPSNLQRQTSHHSSLAAVVYGLMQANRRSTRTDLSNASTTSKN